MSNNAPTQPVSVHHDSAPLTQPEEASIGSLIADATRDISSLLQHEIALVKSEVKVTLKNGGLGAALFAAAGFVLVLAVIMLSLFFVYLLRMTGLDLAWCYGIVFLVYVGIAGVLGFVGFTKVRTMGPPERSIHQAQETKNALMNRG